MMTQTREDLAAFEAPVRQRPTTAPKKVITALAVVALLAVLPMLNITIPGVLPGAFTSPSTQALLATCLIFAVLAMSFDLVFGFTGLLSFGHVLYFALGMYNTQFLMQAGLPLFPAMAVAAILSTSAAVLLNVAALRGRGITYAMVTMAFAEGFFVFLVADPFHVTGREEGLPLATAQVPAWLRTVANAENRYWLAVALVVVTYAIAVIVTRAQVGRIWQALRENEDRIEALGMRTLTPKLAVVALAAAIASLAGSVYLVVVNGATPGVASPNYSLTLIIMVILGGLGRIWGAAIGGFVYGLLTLRLPALPSSGALDSLPNWAANLLSEPGFIIGVIFIVVVMFAPGGIAGASDQIDKLIRSLKPKDTQKPQSPGTGSRGESPRSS